MLLAMAIRLSRSNHAHRIHFAAGWNKRRRAPVSIGVARQTRRPTSNGDPLQWVYRPALTLALTLMRSKNEHLIRGDSCSGASGRRKPRTGDRAGAETAG